jgi:hypothetical protein
VTRATIAIVLHHYILSEPVPMATDDDRQRGASANGK